MTKFRPTLARAAGISCCVMMAQAAMSEQKNVQFESSGLEMMSLSPNVKVTTLYVDVPDLEVSKEPEPGDTGPAFSSISFSGYTPVAKLRSIIASAEAGQKGYDAVQLGARIKPRAKPTDMTVEEIFDWIDATPNQQHAIGRYQFIPNTLRSLMRRGKFDPKARFSPEMQDQLADLLLKDAGYKAFKCGRMPRHKFMNRLAKIWAGLPLSTGKSAYAGVAGNAATLSWKDFDQGIASAFPSREIKTNAASQICQSAAR